MPRVSLLVLVAASIFSLSVARTLAAGWSPQLAAQYLDARQEAWFAWKTAASADGPCVSCHTGLTYLLARPVLRRKLGETAPTKYEKGLFDRLRAHVGSKPPSDLQNVEAIVAALFLAERDRPNALSAETRAAFDQLWSLQLRDGPTRGAWEWYDVDLNPYEHDDFRPFASERRC
jgi:squalene-hopene/tetraprenyl-beta-curcumene cyclase